MNTLEVEYDFVAVIDFLPQADRASWRLSHQLHRYIEKQRYAVNRIDCDSRKEFRLALPWLAAKSKSGSKFLLHFVGHGDVGGLCMPDGKLATWRQISGFLQKIESESIAHSILNMTCCWGLHGIKIVDYLDLDDCFFGIVGPATEISPREGYKINAKFYGKLAAGTLINRIVHEVNHEFGRELLFCITAAGYKRLKAQQDVAPNRGRATRRGNSRVMEGPP
jgi:hypothetical protein